MKAIPCVVLAVLQFVLVLPCAAAAPAAIRSGPAAARCCAESGDELVAVDYAVIGDATWRVETWQRPDGTTYEVWLPVG